MARWVPGCGIRKHLNLYKSIFEVAVLIFIATGASVRSEFLSLDCGGAQASYNDSHNLLWVTDDDYIHTGESYQQPYSGDMQALGSFRYFPEDRSKHCYKLHTPAWSYLVRASFYMDQSEFPTRRPFAFIFSVDATDWFTVTSGDERYYLQVVQEAIFYPPNYRTYFCLRSVYGVPFISSLELREMDDANSTPVYNYHGSDSQFLALGVRYNAGAQQNVSYVRYPADRFDRIWTSPNASVGANFTSIRSPEPTPDTTLDQYYVPSTVMQDAWSFPRANSSSYTNRQSITFKVFADGPQVYLTQSAYAFVVVYTENLNTTALGSTELLIYLEDEYLNTLTFSSEPHMASTPFVALMGNDVKISLAVSDLFLDGDVRPSMNAVEVYSQQSYNASITNGDDAIVIEAFKILFSLTDWQGDPCVPVPHDWLSCDLTEATFRRGQCNNCNDSRSIFATFPNVTSLNLWNVTNINVSELERATSLRLQGLNTMSITSSGIDNRTFGFLIDHSSPGLVALNLSYNAIEAIPQAIDWGGFDGVLFTNLTTLDLSHNQLSGLLSSFEDMAFSTTLTNLDLSYNSLQFFPETWGNTTLSSLGTLNLAHNQFGGNTSSLDEWVKINSESLQELDISDNKLDGGFSSDLYFSLPKLTKANFDNNLIAGVLDLRTWHSKLQAAARNGNQTVTHQLFSFMNNSIVDIVPSAKNFDSATYVLFKQSPAFGIMLYGNPYCLHIESSVQRHLCRYSISYSFRDDSSSSDNKTTLIVGIVGGIVALLLFSITSATLWKLWRQLNTLRGIQQALAERKVQPPFYRYNDLRTATKDFHNDSKLGQGGFGVVYKADLADETLAVKKLFDSHKVQVIDEFLNEVVLITGIKHRNLVQLKGCCIKDKQRMLIYEYAEKGNLEEALWGSQIHGGLNWKQRLNICVGVARGLSYLHEELQPSIIHRDIKPQNILLENNFNPKIADFGLARHVSDETNQDHYTQIAGTLGYLAPEYAMQGQVSDKTDVYSYGILILEVVSGRKCIDSTKPIEEKFLKDWVFNMRKKSLLFDILQPELREDCNVAEVNHVINIALLCVQHHPKRRPIMSQVVNMLSRNLDIDFSSDEFDNMHSNFMDLMADISHDEQQQALPIIEEEHLDSHLVDLGPQASFANSSSTSSSVPNIDLRNFTGR